MSNDDDTGTPQFVNYGTSYFVIEDRSEPVDER